ncbi:hypothetical protein ABEX40_10005 [Bacillus paralicheniformis]
MAVHFFSRRSGRSRRTVFLEEFQPFIDSRLDGCFAGRDPEAIDGRTAGVLGGSLNVFVFKKPDAVVCFLLI